MNSPECNSPLGTAPLGEAAALSLSCSGALRQGASEIGTAPGPAFVHPQALCESNQVGAGTRVWAFAHVMREAVVGRDCNVGDGAFVETGAIVGDRVTIKNQVMIWDGVVIANDCFLGPGVIFTNDRTPRSPRMLDCPKRYGDQRWRVQTFVQRGASLGAGAIVVCGVTIGQYALVGAGAVVTRDVAAHQLVVGNPARPLGWVCLCGSKLPANLVCNECGWRLDPKFTAESLRAPRKTA